MDTKEQIINAIEDYNPKLFPFSDYTNGESHESLLKDIMEALGGTTPIIIFICPDNPDDTEVITETNRDYHNYLNDKDYTELLGTFNNTPVYINLDD